MRDARCLWTEPKCARVVAGNLGGVCRYLRLRKQRLQPSYPIGRF